jgi:hypothetical protein
MSEYYVLNLITRQPYRLVCNDGGENQIARFSDGTSASVLARELTDHTGQKHQPRIFKADEEWRDREQIRLLNGTYKPLPWDQFSKRHVALHYNKNVKAAGLYIRPFDQNNPDHEWLQQNDWFYCRRKGDALEGHFAHISNTPGNVSFTENDEKGARDIQTSIRVGRYLERFYDLDKNEIKALSDTFNLHHGLNRLCFAKTAQEISTIYKRGPSSCMSHGDDHFYNSVHPTIVYGNSDLQLAYLGAFDDKDRLIAVRARCLVYPDRMRCGVPYGNSEYQDKIMIMLQQLGYKGGSFVGARLTKIKHENVNGDSRHYWVMPYLDDTQSCVDDGDMWKIVSYDEPHDFIAGNTNGTIRLAHCDHCGGAVGSAWGVYVEGEQQTWCSRCYDKHGFSCQGCGDYHANEERVLTANGESYCRHCEERVLKVCAATGEVWHYSRTILMENGDRWSRRYYASHGFRCSICRRHLPNKTICTQAACGRPLLTCIDDEGNVINVG